jgi:hypothetical protein
MQWVWQSLWDFIALHIYVSPFWWWVIVGTATVATTTGGAALISFYFPNSTIGTVARSVAGFIAFGSIIWLFGYRRGETDAEKHAREEAAAKARTAQHKDWW